MKKILPLLAVLSVLALTQCAGYRIGADKPAKLAGVTKLAVPTFTNDTLEPRLEVLVTNAVIKKLQMDGTYQIVPLSEADAILKANITDTPRSQFRSVRSNTLKTQELLMRIIVEYTVEEPYGTVLQSGTAQGQSNIFLDTNQQLSETQALADAAEKLSISMASSITEGW